MRWPSSTICPLATRPGGSSKPMMAAPVSDFPAPDSPTIPSVVRRGTEKLILCSTCKGAGFAAMVQGELGAPPMETLSSLGVCAAGISALAYAAQSVELGAHQHALVTTAEMPSRIFKKSRFAPRGYSSDFDAHFLRWMLSDGAAAFLLENKPKGENPLKIEWMEAFSYAHELEACMYAGGDKLENGEIRPWSDFHSNEWLEQSIFAIKQDVKLLDKYILEKGAESMKAALDKNNINPNEITYFLPHVSSHYFVDKLAKSLAERGIIIPMEKWFMNLKDVGNVGSASIYLMVEEIMNSGKLKKGDKLLLSVPESGRFSYAYAYLTVC